VSGKRTSGKFFAEHTNGPDRRAYVQNFRARHGDFEQSLKDELKQKQLEQDARVSNLRTDQAMRFKLFKEAVGRGERPSVQLWPGGSGS
jgi:hypothetical protein